MPKITRIDKSNARDVANIIRDKLSELKNEYGLTVTLEGSMTLQADGSGMSSKINIAADINREDIEAQAKADWALYAPRLTFLPMVTVRCLLLTTSSTLPLALNPTDLRTHWLSGMSKQAKPALVHLRFFIPAKWRNHTTRGALRGPSPYF